MNMYAAPYATSTLKSKKRASMPPEEKKPNLHILAETGDKIHGNLIRIEQIAIPVDVFGTNYNLLWFH